MLSSHDSARLMDHDQILTALGGKIGDFLPFIGGSEHALDLISLLEPLCFSEESHVRNAAASSVNNILKAISTSGTSSSAADGFEAPIEIIMHYWAFIRRMSATENSEVFYPRYTASRCIFGLYFALCNCEGLPVPVVEGACPIPSSVELQEGDDTEKPAESTEYADVAAVKSDVRALFASLQTDEISIVRNGCCASFMDLVNVMEAENVPTVMLDSLRVFLKDDCPPICFGVIEQISAFSSKLKELGNNKTLTEELLPIIKSCVSDDSWKVRLAIAKYFGSFAESYPQPEVATDIFPLAMALLQDHEPDVRQALIPQLLPFLSPVGPEAFVKSFIPVATSLVQDPIPQVRKLVATLSVGIAVKVENTPGDGAISDIIVKFTNDEDPMVRIRILKELGSVAESVPALCQRLAVALKEMFSDSNWRVRQEMVKSIPSLISHVGVEFFETNFMNEYLGMLRDSVDEVRTTVALTLREVVPLVGMEWAYEKIFQAVRPMSNADFLLRLSMLSALEGLLQAELPPGESFQSECLALVVAATNDRVPNVRMKAAQVLSEACNIVGPDISGNHIRPVLNDLQGDADRDVAYFATEGMKLCS